MGGFGSGPQWGSRKTVEASTRLDVLSIHRDGLLRAGLSWTTAWTWTAWGEEQKASIGITCAGSHLILNYRITPPGEDMRYTVPLERTPCNYGNDRPWFRCPNTNCNRRCRFLHSSGRYYLCRKCANLTYRKQQAHRNPGEEASAAGVSLWQEDERWLNLRKDPIRRLRYRLARTRPGSKRQRSLTRRIARLERLQENERIQAAAIIGRFDKSNRKLMRQMQNLIERDERRKP